MSKNIVVCYDGTGNEYGRTVQTLSARLRRSCAIRTNSPYTTRALEPSAFLAGRSGENSA